MPHDEPRGIRYFHATAVSVLDIPRDSTLGRLAVKVLHTCTTQSGGRIVPGSEATTYVLGSGKRVHSLEAIHPGPARGLIPVPERLLVLHRERLTLYPSVCLTCGHAIPPTCSCWQRTNR